MKIFYAAALGAVLLSGLGGVLANDNGERDRSDSPPRREVRGDQRQPERAASVEHRAEVDPRPAAERSNQADQAKRPNHLSAEERRALRQQINEAGQDIYNRQR